MPVLPEKKKEKDEKRMPETRLDGDKDWPIKFGLNFTIRIMESIT